MGTIKFENKKAYEAYKFIQDKCDSNKQCAFCPFFYDEGCVFQREPNPITWPQAELECDTCPAKYSCDEVTDFNDAEMWKEVAEEKIKQIEELKKHIANLDETIRKQEAQLSEEGHCAEISILKAELARKNHYIAKLEGQITKAKEALKND